MAGTLLLVLPMVILFAVVPEVLHPRHRGPGPQGLDVAAAGHRSRRRRPAGSAGRCSGSTSAARSSPPASSTTTAACARSSSRRPRPARARTTALARLFELGRRAVAEAGVAWDDDRGVGIGCGGPLDSDARDPDRAARTSPGWARRPDRRARPSGSSGGRRCSTTTRPRRPPASTASAPGAGTRNMVYLTISTGVGGGVVLDGALYRGATGNGGELGHVTVDWHGRRCRGCGRRGCLEAYVSGTSIAERAREAGLHGRDARRTSRRRARAGDPVAARGLGRDGRGARVRRRRRSSTSSSRSSSCSAAASAARASSCSARCASACARRRSTPAGRASRSSRRRSATASASSARRRSRTSGSRRVAGVARADALAEHRRALARARIERAARRGVDAAARAIVAAYERGGRVFTFGNGGSAADARTSPRSSSARFKRERRPLAAQSLSADPSALTCIANDYSFDDVFERQVRALRARGRRRDRLLDERPLAERRARPRRRARGWARRRCSSPAATACPPAEHADVALVVPSSSTARVQEMHVLLLHLILEQVDAWAAGE